MKERESPVVHQQVRGPDQFRVDSDAFHASILAYIPVQLVVEPVLGNIFFEKRNKLFVGTILIKNGTISMKVGTIAVR